MIYAIIGGHRDYTCIGYEQWEARPSKLYRIHIDPQGSVYCDCPDLNAECKHIRMLRDRKRKPGLWFDDALGKWIKAELV